MVSGLWLQFVLLMELGLNVAGSEVVNQSNGC
jgi:hypothetical protein